MHLYGAIARPIAAGILLLFCLYLGLYHALFGAVIAYIRKCGGRGKALGIQRALLLSPFVWVAVELARARITGFPWDLLGITQVDNLWLTRIAPYCGAYGLSFVIAAVNALWLLRITLKQRRYTRPALILAGIAILLAVVFFERRMQRPVGEQASANATLLQENLEVGAEADKSGPPLTVDEKLRTFSELSLFPSKNEVCDGIPELPGTHCSGNVSMKLSTGSDGSRNLTAINMIVWPESPAGFYDSDPEFRSAISRLARAANAPVIVGTIGVDADPSVKRGYDLYNSADFIESDGRVAGRYNKMHLVPFGEYVPYKNLFFFAGSLLQDVGLFDAGKHRTIFATGGHTYGTFICYESVFGDEVRQFARMGAEVLVNISDDGWYGDTSAAWEHLNMVRMRAIENHRWVLRATNTGVTAAIDPYGRVVTSAPRHIRASLPVRFNYETDVTFYSKYGDIFAYLCALITLCGMGLSLLRKSA